MATIQEEKLDHFYKFYTPEKVRLFNSLSAPIKEKNQNRDFYVHYMNIVHKCALLFKELKVKDAITASAFFQYLLWNGYFSKDKILRYSMSGRVSFMGAMGADIMTGKSVCENNAEMLKDILNCMDMKSYIFGCFLNESESLGMTYLPRIDCPRNNDLALSDKLFGKFVDVTALYRIGNHMVTLIPYEGGYYISDPTNLIFFNFDEVLQAKVVGGSGTIQIKPWVSLVFDNMDDEEFRCVMEGTFASVDKGKMTVSLVRHVCQNVERQFDFQESLFSSFYEDIKGEIDAVCKKLYKKTK